MEEIIDREKNLLAETYLGLIVIKAYSLKSIYFKN